MWSKVTKLIKNKSLIHPPLAPYCTENLSEAGVDEVGRGCLCGDVFAAVVVLPKKFDLKGLTDSKLLTEKERYALRPNIEAQALDFAIGIASIAEIDVLNIANASYLAMHRAIDQLRLKPELLLIDGKYFKPPHFNLPYFIPHQCIIKGDSKFASIAAASVLAKIARDEYMKKLHVEYPEYDWINNMGYPTKKHREAVMNFGITPYHRLSFNLHFVFEQPAALLTEI